MHIVAIGWNMVTKSKWKKRGKRNESRGYETINLDESLGRQKKGS